MGLRMEEFFDCPGREGEHCGVYIKGIIPGSENGISCSSTQIPNRLVISRLRYRDTQRHTLFIQPKITHTLPHTDYQGTSLDSVLLALKLT